MTSVAILGITLLAAPLMAGELDPRLLRILSPGTALVRGIDVERYRSSQLSEFYPVRLDDLPGVAEIAGSRTIRQLIIATADPRSGRMLTMFQSASPLSVGLRADGVDGRGVFNYQGVRLLAVDQGLHFALLDTMVGIVGDEESVHEAIDRWNQKDREMGDIAAKVQQLGRSYDNWFLAIQPLAKLSDPRPASVLLHRDEFIQVLEEVRGGIRFGGYDQMSLEVLAKTVDDAHALAAIGRWLPGLIEMQNSQGFESALAGLAENLVVGSEGRVVTLSFAVAESKLGELVKSLRAEREKEPD